ncbi:MAG: hypothetical protein IRZ16_23305, partial [Myxococcaceae bacterium]|nr:hypothetical protein [Myxococcaceae bacterium]
MSRSRLSRFGNLESDRPKPGDAAPRPDPSARSARFEGLETEGPPTAT